MVNDTCLGKECKIYKKLKLKDVEECPNYIIHIFTNEKGEKKTVKDCLNQRLSLMIQDLISIVDGLRQEVTQLRNQSQTVNNTTMAVMTNYKKQLEKKKYEEIEE